MELSSEIINKKNISNIIRVALVSVFSLGAALLSGFVIPRILTASNYGYYQTAHLYAAYLGVLPLGFFDGILLTYAGKKREELPVNRFRFYWIIMFILHVIFMILFVLLGALFFTGMERWILIYLGIQLFFGNLTSFFANISTMTSNFKMYNWITFSATVLRFANLITITLLYLFRKDLITQAPFYLFLGVSLLPTILMFFIYLYKYKEITFGRFDTNEFNPVKETLYLVKIGFPLLISNLVILFILENDRQFVQIAFDIATYATYAFAYSLLGLISNVLISISLVLFPELKKIDSKVAMDQYSDLIGTLSSVVAFLSFGFFVVEAVVLHWLPAYTESLKIFRVVLSGYICYSCSVIINQNYYKANMMNVRFLICSICILALAVGLNFAAYYIFGNIYYISLATLISISIWFLITSFPLSRKIHFTDWRNYLYIFAFIIGFNLFSLIPMLWLDILLSVLLFVLLTVLLQKHFLIRLFNVFRRMFQKLRSKKNS